MSKSSSKPRVRSFIPAANKMVRCAGWSSRLNQRVSSLHGRVIFTS